MPDKNKKNKASKFRMMRPVQGQYFPGQVEGSVSTHISSVFESDGKYFVAPTITNKKAPYAGYQPQSFGEAYKAGEAIPFDSFDEAMFFSQNYKLPKYPRPEFKNGGETDPLTNPFAQQNQAYITQLQAEAATGSEMAIHQLQLLGQDARIPDADFSAGMAEYMPVTGEISDAVHTADALSKGNYGDAALYGAGFMLPFVPGKAVKEFVKGVGKSWKRKRGKIHKDFKDEIPVQRGKYHSTDDLLELRKQNIKTSPGLKSANPELYYHGTGSGSFTGIKRNEGVVPAGQLDEGTGLFGGEQGHFFSSRFGPHANETGISTTRFNEVETPLTYSGVYSKPHTVSPLDDYNKFVDKLPKISERFGAEVGAKMQRSKLSSLSAWNKANKFEKNLIENPYPAVFGINPKGAGKIDTRPLRSDIPHEQTILGKVGYDELSNVYVPKSKMREAEEYFEGKINVMDLEDLHKLNTNVTQTDKYKWKKYGGSMKKFKYDNGGKGSKTYLDSQRKRVTGSPIIPGMNFESDATMFGSPLLDPSYMQMMLDDQPGDQAPFDYRSIMNEDLYLDNVRKKPTTDFDAFLKAYRESGIDDRAYGGKAEVDYEAEDGEVVIGNISVNKAYNGGTAERYKGADMYMLKGARHSDGGIGIKMHGGDASYVFSDRLDAGGMSYAKAASKFGKELDEVNQMAMGGDAYDVNTAKRMSPRLMAEVKDLYDDQEAYKKEQGIDQDPDKMFLGGLIKKGVGALTKLGAGAGLGPLGVAATMLPGVLNIGKGLFGRKPEVDLGTVEPMFQDYQDFSPMEQRFLNQQDRSLAQLQAGLGASGASGQQLRAGVQAGQAGAQAGASQFYNQLGAMEMQNQSQVDGYNIQQQQQADMQNMQLRAQEAQMEANLDPRQSLGKGLSQIMGTVTSLGQQNQKMDMLNKVFGAYGGQFGLRKKY